MPMNVASVPHTVSRRDFLRIGSLAAAASLLPDFIQEPAKVSAAPAAMGMNSIYLRPINGNRDPGISLILIHLNGGMSHFDTFDPRSPSSPPEIRGPFSRIETNVRDVYLTEPFQHLSRCMDKVQVVRNLYHSDSGHPSALGLMLTGNPELIRSQGDSFYWDSKHASPVLELSRHLTNSGNPSSDYIVTHYYEPPVPENIAPFTRPMSGTLHQQEGVFYVPYNNENGVFPNPFSGNIDVARLEEVFGLIDAFNSGPNTPQGESADRLGRVQNQARSRLTGDLRNAFNLENLPAEVRDRYGRNPIGDQLLLSRALVEAVSRIVVASTGHFDHHYQLERHMRRLLPQLDQSLAALIEDIHVRDLPVVVAVISEFGRTPRMNSSNGRDHWSYSNSMLLAGRGIQGGRVIGEVRDNGEINLNACQALDASKLGEELLHKIGWGRFRLRGTVRTNEVIPGLNIN